ncbi:AAA family ATPase [Leeuwenhoekiella polynyae]|uniref:ATPase family protein associated with various cellular activities (AAA) n=1 Tax=Leeuwenhoekiella polynyae TaxID=1550906 RepID=A0A4V1KQ37_9FLAO|nr:ATP-binding protein [Leeuwenhoekiella polynyae]RXG20052.1 ATPase family protein associated with various cellular activities (AAA) [Leeuwenhoekiella polynyae]
MAAAEKIKALLQSYGDKDDARFYTTAMQIAASEAKKGHIKLAEELKVLIDKIRTKRSVDSISKTRILPVNEAQKELKDLLEVYRPQIKTKDMVLAPQVSEAIERILSEQRKFDQLLQHNLEPRRKLMLVGPPGCGKTMTAKAIAGDLEIPLFIIRLDGLISRYMGESISKVKMIFDSMYQHRAVYLFDEFDSIGSNRSYGNEVGEIRRVLNGFLMNIEKDESNSLLIVATNIPESLDKALFRRFDDIIQYPLPKEKEISELLEVQLKGYELSKGKTINTITKEALGLSFADISNACKDAIKEMIVQNSDKISSATLFKFIKSKKTYF